MTNEPVSREVFLAENKRQMEVLHLIQKRAMRRSDIGMLLGLIAIALSICFQFI